MTDPLTKAAQDFVWTLFVRCWHDNEGHSLQTIERYLVRRWSRNATCKITNEGLAGDGLDVEAAVNTLRRGGIGERQARHLAVVALAAALTGERHDLDDEYLTADQRHRLAALAKETP